MPTASIVVPTRGRPGYLHVTLDSIAPQAAQAGAEVIVVDDGGDAVSRAVAEEHGARYLAHERPLGPNAAATRASWPRRANPIVLVDDDVHAPPGWLAALLAGVEANPGHDAFGGPIRVHLEGTNVRSCGREGPPVTSLYLGDLDRDADFVWSANMAIRTAALERVGAFDPDLEIYGDEEEWQRRLHAAGGRIRYVAAAGLTHRRAGPDARLSALCRAAFRRGPPRPPLRRPQGHGAGRRRGAARAARVARARGAVPLHERARHGRRGAGRLREMASAAEDDFLSGSSGTVTSRRAGLRDAAYDAAAWLSGRPVRLARAAAQAPPPRRVLVLASSGRTGTLTPTPSAPRPRARATTSRSRSSPSATSASSSTSTCCWRSTPRRGATGSCSSTTTWSCRVRSSTRSCSSPSASTSPSRSPRTGGARTARGTSRGVAPARWCARPRSWRSGP